MLALGRGTGKCRYLINRSFSEELESEDILLKHVFRVFGRAILATIMAVSSNHCPSCAVMKPDIEFLKRFADVAFWRDT